MNVIEEIPEPLVPPEVDLRNFPFTPIFRSRLFGSEFHANATDAEWRAGVTLWLKSWDQVPAGSLPVDDVALCRLAEFGRDMRGWMAVKVRALHGWRFCSDGRLHHAVVAQGVLEAWEKRKKNKERGMAGASARWGASNALTIRKNGQSIPQAMLTDGNRQGQGIDKDNTSPPTAPSIEQDFEDFWQLYPRKVDKKAALKSFKAAMKRASLSKILTGAERYAEQRKGEDLKFTKHPATWLNNDCWANTAAPASATAAAAEPSETVSEFDQLLIRVFGNVVVDVGIFRKTGMWVELGGRLRPDDPKTGIDPVVLSRHGYADPKILADWRAEMEAKFGKLAD